MTNDQSVESPALTRHVSSKEPLAEAVVSAVAWISGADPAPDDSSDGDVLEPLYTAVDPEALESVCRSHGTDADRAESRVTFSYHGCDVTITGGDRVTVTRPEARNEAAD